MPTIKLSKVPIPKPGPTPPPPPAPGAPGAPAPVPAPPAPGGDGGGIDSPPVGIDPTVDGVGEGADGVGEGVQSFAGRAAEPDVAEIPTELLEKLFRAVDIVPGLTLSTALTLALQQFLASLPDTYDH